MKWIAYTFWIFYVIIQGGKVLDTTASDMVFIIVGLIVGLIVLPLTFLVETE